ncbi:MAG: gliding motility protein GldN [Bacteroidia bacterium]|nr:gliding motility protein GldN [Bacteroidia bacterium]
MRTLSKKAIVVVVTVFLMLSLNHDVKSQSNILDGVYIKEHSLQRKVIPYSSLREADVMWSKRIWRIVDLREKINQDFYFPTDPIAGRKSLMQVVWDGVTKDGSLIAYSDENDGDFTTQLSKTELDAKYNSWDTTQIENFETGELEEKITQRQFIPAEVKQIKIKEEWFFDRQRSVMDVRIIGLAPVRFYEKNGEERIETMFWIYFPEARFTFVNAEVYNKGNDAERRTYDDIFMKRRFSSYIYKESNVYNRRINAYLSGLDALLEAEKIKEDIFNTEHDLWEY